MIVNKFNYTPIPRVNIDGKRHYQTPNGEKIPSVTTILDKTKPAEDKAGLEKWRRRVGHKKAQEITTEAASRGTRMHKWLEDYLLTGDAGQPGSNPYSKQSHRMASLIIDNGLAHLDECWGVEVPLYFPSVYAGSTDCVGMYNGKPAIVDFKQTNKPKKDEWIKDYRMQLCAYGEAHNEIHGTDIRTGVILMCSKDYELQMWVIEEEEYDHWRREWWKRVGAYYGA